jgi:hypothetical protein
MWVMSEDRQLIGYSTILPCMPPTALKQLVVKKPEEGFQHRRIQGSIHG